MKKTCETCKKIIEEEFPQPSVAEIRKQLGIGPNVSDEELLLRYALSEDEVNAIEKRFQEENDRLKLLKKDRRQIEQDLQEIENNIENSINKDQE